MREVLIGFDSAWTDSPKNPGAVAACVLENGRFTEDHLPRLATFADALSCIRSWTERADFVLIALDQPTVVPNHDGCRPVDRVAGSLISGLKGGVQPARRGGAAASMFGDGAPVWSFLSRVDAMQDAIAARSARSGRYLMEVFPALALPALVPEIWARRRAAKYNPVNANFDLLDWRLVSTGGADFARGLGASGLGAWMSEQSALKAPRKADQDRLDAAVCLCVALAWRFGPAGEMLLLGDERTGYMATIASGQMRNVLTAAAVKCQVPVNSSWTARMHPIIAEASVPIVREAKQLSDADVALSSRFRSSRPAKVDPIWLRAFLIERSRSGRLISYGEVADELGFPWTQGFMSSLKSALNLLGRENRSAGEPMLMCLVVNNETRLPGDGFFESSGSGEVADLARKNHHAREVLRCRRYAWPSAPDCPRV